MEKQVEKVEKLGKYKKLKYSCEVCNGKGYYVSSETYTPYHSGYNRWRCDCTFIPTKKYQKALDNINISKKEYDSKLALFYDNYSHIVD